MWVVSVVGRSGIIWLVVGVALTLARRVQPSGLIQLALTILLASLVTDRVLKPLIGRERPFVSTPDIRVIGGRPADASFPSGHAANAFAGSSALSRIVPGARIVWWAMALTIAYSRVYLGVHYPLDVIGGAAMGWLCGLLLERVLDRLRGWRAGPRAR